MGITQSKAKMFEYQVPREHHIVIPQDPARLFSLAIGLLGDLAAQINSNVLDQDAGNDLWRNLRFSARFFDAYLETRLQEDLNPYLLLLGAASYYLCDLPGSSLVLAKRLGEEWPYLDCLGLEALLFWLLRGNWSTSLDRTKGPYGEQISAISRQLVRYFIDGEGHGELVERAALLRRIAYDVGTPRQLLFADVSCAIIKQRLKNSTWNTLSSYSGIPVDKWQSTLQKESFIRELWPAQHLLGRRGVFRGNSAVVQMPTGVGKTKAIEIIVRSAFLSQRTRLVVIVAPFRALCHEIRSDLVESFRNEPTYVEELSDVLQIDFETAQWLTGQRILVVTPEKLVYALRYAPYLAKQVGLLIYDEGHQFDSNARGMTYELLLTSLKAMVPKEAQVVLISAVIQNADTVGRWLKGEECEIIHGSDLVPTYRSVAFASWVDRQRTLSAGWLRFDHPNRTDDYKFYVPRVIKQYSLTGRKKLFPSTEKKDGGKEVALYLGLKLSPSGSVAVFCGRKDSASKLCEDLVSAYKKHLPMSKPVEFSDQAEVRRLHFLHERNLGTDAPVTKSASLGVFAHHANIPQGIRMAVEYAMKEGLARFVICTSTLAQGVNLPIRYLIVTSVYQGQEQIKVRDFHNLMGRAGRSGMYTEGSVLFADPRIYDDQSQGEDWRWRQVKDLLEPSRSEPCLSQLSLFFEPLYSEHGAYTIPSQVLIQAYDDGSMGELAGRLSEQHADEGFTLLVLEKQISEKMAVIAAIESHLMTYLDYRDSEELASVAAELAAETFAYFIADDEKKAQIVELFRLIARRIAKAVPETERRRVFGRTLYGVHVSITIEDWVKQNINDLVVCDGYDDLLSTLWPLLSTNIRNNTFQNCTSLDARRDVAFGWIQSKPFYELLAILQSREARIGTGKRPRHPKVEHIVDICENALAYDGTLLVGAVAEMVGIVRPAGGKDLIRKLRELQKQLKYGLSSPSAIALCEMGFADRVVSTELSQGIALDTLNRNTVTMLIRQNESALRTVLEKYPRYFSQVMNEVV